MEVEKKIADILEICYFSKASVEDISFLLNYLIENSSLDKTVKENKPIFDLSEVGETKDHISTQGEYYKVTRTVYINRVLVDQSRIAYPYSLTLLFDTVGHEIAHYYQHITNQKYKEINKKWSKEEVLHLCKAINKPNSESLCKDVSYASYLIQKDEENAREKGAEFAMECFEFLLSNKYIKDEVKSKLQDDYKTAIDCLIEYKEKDKSYYEIYDIFIEYYKSRNLFDFMNEFTKGKLAKKYLDAIDFWIELHTDEEIANNYFMLLGAPSDFNIIRDYVTKYILKEDFDKKVRINLMNSIVLFLSNKPVIIEMYDKYLWDLLDKKDVLKIYEALLKKDVSKLKGEMFKKLKHDVDTAKYKAKIILKNKHALYIRSREDKNILDSEIEDVCSLLNGQTNMSIIRELKDVANNLNVKKQKQVG